MEYWFESRTCKYRDKINTIKFVIFQNEKKRRERLAYIDNELKTDISNKLGIKIPKKPISLISSYLPEHNVSKERTALIEKAEQELHKKQQS